MRGPLRLASSVCAGLVLACGASVAAPGPSAVDSILKRCPTAAEVAQSSADVHIAFAYEPAPGTLACTAAAGSADLTREQEVVYQTLTVMRSLRFTRPLPWTSQSLYDWFRGQVHGVRIVDPASIPGGNGFCCDPPGVIVAAGLPPGRALDETRWIDPLRTGHVSAPWQLLETFVHEARHVSFGPHDCGVKDRTYSELGAWGVHWYLKVWLALYSGRFLDAPDPYPSAYRELEYGSNLDVVCAPGADVLLKVADTPEPVASGGLLTYRLGVRNGGPGDAPGVFVYQLVPGGTRLVRAVAGRGSCTAVSAAPGSSVGCDLGDLPSGAGTTVRFVFRVTARPGATITNRPAGPGGRHWLPFELGTAVKPAAHDPSGFFGNARLVTTKVGPRKR